VSGKIRVLLVDDEAELIRAFKKKLGAEGFSGATAMAAKEALSPGETGI
jgi:CheY-like chemotaxis protein